MLAAEPPLTSTPEAVDGKPSQRLNQSSTTSSTWLGPAPPIHQQASTLSALAMKSPSAPGKVPSPGMKAK